MVDTAQRLQTFLDNNQDIEIFEIILPDIAGGLRGKWVTRDKIAKVVAGELKLPASSLAFDVFGRDVEAWVFDSGDGDGYCEAALDTLVRVPWASRPTGQLLVSLRLADGKPSPLDSRYLLQALLDRLAVHGVRAVMATEMEFYLLEEGRDDLGRPLHTQTDRVGGVTAAGQTYSLDAMAEMSELMHAIRDACEQQGLPVDTLIKESAPSQYEINLYHCDNALRAADHAVMLQRAIKGVSREHNLRATFMAKPFGELAGNGMHVHCSLVDEQGKNLFDDGSGQGTSLLRHAVAGCLDHLADSMLLLAPNLNSYRRFQRGSHAPLAPCWGYENRTVSLRIPADVAAATRIEHRVAGADAQPHLVLAVILAAIVDGIEQQRQAPEPLTGNAYEQLDASLPCYWPDALGRFARSAFIKDSFGEDFQRVFTLLKEQELDAFDHQVTPLEYDACL